MFLPEAEQHKDIYVHLQSLMDIIGATVSNVDETAVPEQPPDGFQELSGLASSSSVDYTAPKPELPSVPTGCEETPGLASAGGCDNAEPDVFMKEEFNTQDGLHQPHYCETGWHVTNDAVWNVDPGSVDGSSAPLPPSDDLTNFGTMAPPSGGWMAKVVPLLVAIKLMHHEGTWSIAMRLANHESIKTFVKDHHLTMIHRGHDSRYYTR